MQVIEFVFKSYPAVKPEGKHEAMLVWAPSSDPHFDNKSKQMSIWISLDVFLSYNIYFSVSLIWSIEKNVFLKVFF